jgi:hypothetical protein
MIIRWVLLEAGLEDGLNDCLTLDEDSTGNGEGDAMYIC